MEVTIHVTVDVPAENLTPELVASLFTLQLDKYGIAYHNVRIDRDDLPYHEIDPADYALEYAGCDEFD